MFDTLIVKVIKGAAAIIRPGVFWVGLLVGFVVTAVGVIFIGSGFHMLVMRNGFRLSIV